DPAVCHEEDRPRRQLADAAEHRGRSGDELVAQVVVQGLDVHLAGDVGVLEDRLDLGAEQEAVGALGVVERLDPDAVAGQEELAGPAVPQGEGEEAAEALDAPWAPRLVGVHHHLAVAPAAEPMAEDLQLPAEGLVVEDLAVVDELDRAVLVGDRLGAGRREVDDLQPAPDEPDRALLEDAALVGPPVLEDLAHRLQQVSGDRLAVAVLEDAGDATHQRYPCSLYQAALRVM